jgi:ABC-2 type transport system ATP-binding protein
MQQKVGFVRALLHEPDLLILDEPVSGLDPMGIHQVEELIRSENKRGKTVFISSHLLSEIEKLCNRVGIMNHGQLLAEDRMENIVRRLTDDVELEIELSEADTQAENILRGLSFVSGVSINDRFLRVRIQTDRDYRQDLVRFLMSQGHVPVGIRTRSMSLEEAFISITTENISLLAGADK